MAYLTVNEYLARFGDIETIRLTSEVPVPGAPVMETDKVETAIDDAVETCNGYIAVRYTTPLESAPPIVKGWVAAIARETLYRATGRIPEAIKDAADLARAQLLLLSTRKLNLPIEEGGEATPETSAGLAYSSNDRECPVFTRTTLSGYLDPFTGAQSVPRWRNGG